MAHHRYPSARVGLNTANAGQQLNERPAALERVDTRALKGADDKDGLTAELNDTDADLGLDNKFAEPGVKLGLELLNREPARFHAAHEG
jgi:hypothetical protein